MQPARRVWRAVSARPWLTAAVVVVLAGAIIGYALLRTGGTGTAAAATTSRLVSVSKGTVRKSVSTTGDLEPTTEEDVSFPTTAEVTAVRVRQGETVRKGQLLGKINDLSLRASVASAAATLASAKATLASAEDDDSTTTAQLAADRSTVSTDRAALRSAREERDDATLRSPIAGVVAEVNVTKGEDSSGSGSSSSSGDSSSSSTSSNGATGSSGDTGSSASTDSSGTTGSGSSTSGSTSSSSSSGDFVIIGTKKWQVTVDVDDTEVGQLKTGQQAQITTDNVSGTIFGTVTSVSVLSSDSSGSASYPVTISVTGTPSGLHDGAEATVAVIYKQATNVLTVPAAAVHSDGTSSYVYLSSQGKKVKQTVKTGLTDGTTTQVTSGLQSGEQVYLETVLPGSGSRHSGSSTNRGGFPSSGNFPGGGSGYFPAGGSGGGNFGGGSGNFGGGR